MPQLRNIFLKRSHGGLMDARLNAMLDDKGLVGNAHRGGRRQLAIVSSERWAELMHEVGASLDPGVRRANLVVSGVDLENTRGRVLRIGDCRVRINGELRPCELMDEAAIGLQEAMSHRWGGGVFAEVVNGGPIAVGDDVAWEN